MKHTLRLKEKTVNTQKDITKRLLRLFPTKLLKDSFVSGTKPDDLLEYIVTKHSKNIVSFLNENRGQTKQHIYVFDLKKKVSQSGINLDDFPYTIEDTGLRNGKTKITIYPIIDFNVTISNPLETTMLKFKQPVCIELFDDKMVISFTMLEKNIQSYFPPDRKVYEHEKTLEEDVIIREICTYFGKLNPKPSDLNKGIKYLWANDIVDSKYAKWKKSKSTTTEVMDEEYTLKTQYPDVYNDLVNAPLKKMVFKYLLDDELFPSHFAIDPSLGVISISLYPNDKEQANYVTGKIISNNR